MGGVGEEQEQGRSRAGEEQVRSKSRAGEGKVGSWDDGSVLGHLFRFLVSLRPFVKLIICREDEG